jgi:hypothetical protein
MSSQVMSPQEHVSVYSGFVIRLILQLVVYYRLDARPATRLVCILLLDAVDTLPYNLRYQRSLAGNWTYESADKINDLIGYVLIHGIVQELQFPDWYVRVLSGALVLRVVGVLCAEYTRSPVWYAYFPDLYREFVLLMYLDQYKFHWSDRRMWTSLLALTALKLVIEFHVHAAPATAPAAVHAYTALVYAVMGWILVGV